MSRAPKTLMEVIYVRTKSFRDTAQVFKLIVAWSAAMKYYDTDELGIEQFNDWAADGVQSRKTSQRQMVLFRKAFPGHSTPNKVCIDFELVGAEVDPMTPLLPSYAVA